MVGARFLLAFLAWPLAGLIAFPAFDPGGLDRAGRIGFAGLIGAVAIGIEMFVASWLGARCSLALLLPPLFLAAAIARASARGGVRGARPTPRLSRGTRAGLAAAAAGIAALVYMAWTARATSYDLLLFWGPKAARFAVHRGIDADFLARYANRGLHPDYPPLLPLLDSFGALFAGRFPWEASLLSTPIFLALGVCSFWGCARFAMNERRAAELSAVLTLLLAYGICATLSIGNAEPLLLAFEVAALSALTFLSGPRAEILASAMLAGLVLTKLEGLVAAFLIALVFTFGEGWRGRTVRLVLLPSVIALLWLFYCRQHGLIWAYRAAEFEPPTFKYFSATAAGVGEAAELSAAYAPWIALVLLFVTDRDRRLAVRPLLVGLGFLVATFGFYLHSPIDPTAWIRWSANRLLLTVLVCGFFSVSTPTREPVP